MSQILIAFASTHGHTAKIATRVAEVVRAGGHTVHVIDDVGTSDPLPKDFDAVVAGASIHHGHHQGEIVAWAHRHGAALNLVPSAFFSVCMVAAEDNDESRATARSYLDDFEELTGWTPRRRATFAGALQYRQYDFLTRLVMRVLMHRGHHPTDTSRDFDYTDWNAVEAFARDCARLASLVTAKG